MLRRIAHGARISLLVGLAVVAGASTMGVTLGMLSGYLGGTADTIIMRVMDVLLAFPGILLAIAIVRCAGRGC